MTLPLQKAVNSLFSHCGTTGNYKGKRILFMVFQPDEVVGVGFTNVVTEKSTIRIRIGDAPELAVGDLIESDETTYKIMSTPRKDLHNLIWRAEVICD